MTNGEKFKSAKERVEAFAKHRVMSWNTPLEEIYGWLDLEAPAEEPLPCPFCGGKCVVEHTATHSLVLCNQCEFGSPLYDDDESAITAHNRVARAVAKEAK